MKNILTDISELPHYRKYTCRACGGIQESYVLDVYGVCDKCGAKMKLRGFAGIGSETEDVIDAVLQWIGSGQEFERAMRRKEEIDRYQAEETDTHHE